MKTKQVCRTFVPVSQYCGNTTILTCINKWIWTRSRGLRVVYKDGLICKSEYTLKELFKGEKVKEV